MKKLKILGWLILLAAIFAGLAQKVYINDDYTKGSDFMFNTECSITINKRNCNEIMQMAFDKAARIHKMTDYFDKESDVSKINEAGAGVAVSVNKEILDILSISQKIYDETNGAFDVTVAPVSIIWFASSSTLSSM